MDRDLSRRAFLGAFAATAGGSVAGCQTLRGDEAPAGQQADPVTTAAPGEEGGETPVSGRYAEVYEAISPSVASVSVYGEDRRAAQGSAFAYEDDLLVTNEHVVGTADEVAVRFEHTGWRSAAVVATDVYSDLAVLDATSLPDDASPLSFNGEVPPVGTEVVAIGNPFGFSGSVSAGIVSGVNRTLPAPNGFSIPDAVQTDAAVNPGNSGGPLVTLDGTVVGVVNAGGGDNIGFAISAALARRVLPELIENGEYEHAYLGVHLTGVTPTIAVANELETARGVYVDGVVDDSPSDGVFRGTTERRTVDGVRTPVGGDVVVEMDGTPIPTQQALSSHLALETRPGDTIEVVVLRGGTERTVEVTLGSRPEPDR